VTKAAKWRTAVNTLMKPRNHQNAVSFSNNLLIRFFAQRT